MESTVWNTYLKLWSFLALNLDVKLNFALENSNERDRKQNDDTYYYQDY